MRFRISALFYGVIIYAVSNLATTVLLNLGVYDRLAIMSTIYISFAIAAYFAGRALDAESLYDIIPYAVGWTSIVIILDALAVPGNFAEVLLDSSSLLAYAIVFVASFLAFFRRSGSTFM